MKNKEKWKPSKYIFRKGHLIASRDKAEVGVGSRLIVDIAAMYYQTYIPLHVKGKLLDLGCGKIPLYQMYKDYISDNICVDWKKSYHDTPCLDFTCDLSEKLPFEDNQFDTIILSDVLEHLMNPKILWKEMHRILIPKGKLLLNVPFLYWIHEEPHDYYRFTEFALKQFAETNNFSVILLEPIGGIPDVLTDILSKFFMRYPYCIWMATSLQYFTSLLNRTTMIKRISKKTSKLFPLGYFLIAEKSVIM